MTVVEKLTAELDALKCLELPAGAPGEIYMLITEISEELSRLSQYPDPPPQDRVGRLKNALMALRCLINNVRRAHVFEVELKQKKQEAVLNATRIAELEVWIIASAKATADLAVAATEHEEELRRDPCPPPPGGFIPN